MLQKSNASVRECEDALYEFGVKVTVANTLKEGLVVGMRSMPVNPWDGHTLAETLEQVRGAAPCAD